MALLREMEGDGVPDHIDLILNEWQAGYQVLVARAHPLDADIKVELIATAPKWEEILRQPIEQPNNGPKLYPQDSPREFLGQLSEHISGSTFFASALHSEDECPFSAGETRIPLRDASL